MLILASMSPRRMSLLKKWRYVFQTVNIDVGEYLPENVHPEKRVQLLAESKAKAGIETWRQSGGSQNDVILAADTMVFLEGIALGKPQSEQEATDMLSALSGKSHRVLTGVAIFRMDGNGETDVVETMVSFRELTEQEIEAYVQSGDPLDKAGSYGIQGAAGDFVAEIRGSLTNVIGLPMEFLQERLKAWGIQQENITLREVLNELPPEGFAG